MLDILCLSEMYLPHKGGHVIWLHEVLRRLGGATVVAGELPDLPRSEDIDGVDVLRVPLRRLRWLRPESLPLYVRMLIVGATRTAQLHPQVLVAPRVLPEGLVANLVGRLFRLPCVVFAHGEEISRAQSYRPLPVRRKATYLAKRSLLWRVFYASDLIIANSRSTERLLSEGGVGPEKVSVVHPGTCPRTFAPGEKDYHLARRLGLHGAKIILTVGRLTRRKGHDMVMRAMPQILRRCPDAIYVIGGAGGYGKDLRALAVALGIQPKVRFLGEVPQDLLPGLFRLADVFVMPNRETEGSHNIEGFGIVFLEASACAVPVVGGRSGGAPEAIAEGETGLLVDGTSPREIAEAVVRILQDPALSQRLGRNGRRRVLSGFTWDHSAGRIRELLAKVARKAEPAEA